MWTKCGKLYFLKTCVLAYDRKTLIARNPRINLVLPDIILLNSFTFLMYETCVSVFVCVCVCLCACVSLCVYLCVEGGLVVYGLIPLSSHKATTASRRWLPWDTSCPPPLDEYCKLLKIGAPGLVSVTKIWFDTFPHNSCTDWCHRWPPGTAWPILSPIFKMLQFWWNMVLWAFFGRWTR